MRAAAMIHSEIIKENRLMNCTAVKLFLSLCVALTLSQMALCQTQNKFHGRPGPGLLNLPGLLVSHRSIPPSTTTPVADPVALGMAKAKVYRFSTADYPGAALSGLFDTNSTTAVGFFVTDPVNAPTDVAFTLKNGLYQIVAVPGASTSFLTGINTGGQLVGSYFDQAGVPHGFLDDNGAFTVIDYPGAIVTYAFGINDSGQTVGTFADSSSVGHGFIENNSVFTAVDFPGAVQTNAMGNNSGGDVVGVWQDAALNIHGFLLSGGVFTTLDFPLASVTQPFGINDSSEIAGTYLDAADVSHGFIYSNGSFSRVDVAGAKSTVLNRIKNGGAIAGEFTDVLDETHGVRGH